MNIVWLASEVVPFAKTGGLADVSGALPEALAERGHQVSVILPWYPQITGKLNLVFDETIDLLGVPFGDKTEWASIHKLHGESRNLTFYFIEYNRFFDRPTLYTWDGAEYADSAQRFIFFSRACMQAILKLRLHPDILHANDWHTALACVYLQSPLYRNDPNFSNCRSILSIHNIGYQGIFPKSNLYWTGLGWEYFHCDCLEFYDQINLLKGGIMTADRVNAVSPTYAREILSPEYGFALDPALRHRAYYGALRGIINGIDIHVWNPAADKNLPACYNAEDLTGKQICRHALQDMFHLPKRDDVPLFTSISRFAVQKGLDVFADALSSLLDENDFQFIVIGSGDKNLENWFRFHAQRHPDKFAVYVGFAKDDVSHLAEAGADFFVMPSRYEPCGLNQMYSMRYGTLPIVRRTGGLADTVLSYNYKNADQATGFVFWDLYPDALAQTIRWAASVRKEHPEDFRQMIHNAMTHDFSWNNTAAQYERMYEDAHR